MFIIDNTYFIRENYIPNVGTASSAEKLNVEMLIDEKCPLFLRDYALGIDLYNSLLSNMTNGVLKNDAQDKWKNLVNGCEYTINGENFVWQGLKYEMGSFKGSLLADYITYLWLEQNYSTTTGLGQKVVEAKNTISVSANAKLAETWNRFLMKYNGGLNINEPTIWYKDGVRVVDYFKNSSNSASLIQFLQQNPLDYPDALCRCFEQGFINRFGL